MEGVQILPVIQNYGETFGLIRELTRKVFLDYGLESINDYTSIKIKTGLLVVGIIGPKVRIIIYMENGGIYGIVGKGIKLAKTKAEVSGDCFLSFFLYL